MDLVVIVDEWGYKKKGDVLKGVHPTTGKALIKSGVVKDVAAKESKKETKKSSK